MRIESFGILMIFQSFFIIYTHCENIKASLVLPNVENQITITALQHAQLYEEGFYQVFFRVPNNCSVNMFLRNMFKQI